jgi:uncharacterized protein YdeI (YjbR/CyaY-like superfamily)
VDIEADTEPQNVTVPAELAEALVRDSTARAFFAAPAYSHRKEWVRWVDDAKKPETRSKRLATTVDALRRGRRTR